MRPFVVGITGGIGSGKSTVCGEFARLGAPFIDADVIARDVVIPGRPAFAEIVAHFGSSVVGPDHALRRDVLRNRIYGDDRAKHVLEAAIHPRVRARIFYGVETTDTPYLLVCVPLLVESRGYDRIVDRILVIECDLQLRIDRAMQRDGLTRDNVEAIIRSQATSAERLIQADDVVDNNSTLESMYKRVADLHRQYLECADDRSHQH